MSVNIERQLTVTRMTMPSGATSTTPMLGIGHFVAGTVKLPAGKLGMLSWRARSYKTNSSGYVYDDVATRVLQVAHAWTKPLQMAIRPEVMQCNFVYLVCSTVTTAPKVFHVTLKG